LTLSVSPTLYDMSASRGQEWKSNIRVINVNKFTLTVYVDVVNFSPKGESGDVNFIPVSENESTGQSLAEWINITKEPITIPAEQTMEIPFTIKVPEDASPGGHYAAILVGTRPLQKSENETKIQISQMVTSLVFTKVAGAINETGIIREFRTTKKFLDEPEATFELRFENKGNVYVQPQGEIKILNMWGQERGFIPVNQNSHYGKVPHKTHGSDGIRKFTFNWRGEWSISDIGRYKAVATLAYGSESRQTVSSETTFWVIPLKLFLGIIGGIALFIILLIWLVRIYVRKMLMMAGLDVDEYKNMKKNGVVFEKSHASKNIKFHAPVQASILDLKKKLVTSKTTKDYFLTFANFIYRNRLFFLAKIIIIFLIFSITWYVKNARVAERSYEVTYLDLGQNVSMSSEDIYYDKLKHSSGHSFVLNSELPTVNITNRSGISGLGAKVKIKLEEKGFLVENLDSDSTRPQVKTVVVYGIENQEIALEISKQLNNALLSVYSTEEGARGDITIFVGSDMQ